MPTCRCALGHQLPAHPTDPSGAPQESILPPFPSQVQGTEIPKVVSDHKRGNTRQDPPSRCCCKSGDRLSFEDDERTRNQSCKKEEVPRKTPAVTPCTTPTLRVLCVKEIPRFCLLNAAQCADRNCDTDLVFACKEARGFYGKIGKPLPVSSHSSDP